jgi:hypothetical protein
MTLLTRLAATALVGLASVGAAGCDSADPQTGTGPVVQFGTNAVSVLEGSVRADSVATTTVGTRVSIPVRLTGANGTPVTVEVLYAAGPTVSTARPGVRNADGTFPTGGAVDFVDFGAVSEGHYKATVTFSGTVDTTQVVTFTVIRDGVGEVSETAVFALQRVVGATLGTVTEFRANIGVPTIAAVRGGALNSTVTVEGIVTRAKGRNVWIQDATGGLVLFGPAGSPIATAITLGTATGGIAVGDRIQATGRLVEFQASNGLPGTGLLEVDNIVAGAFTVLNRGNALPGAQTITLAQFTAGDPDPDTYESELIRVENLTVDPAGDVVFVAAKNYTASQTIGGVTTTAILRIGSAGDTDLIGTPIPTGTFTFQGPAGQFRSGNQLTPVLVSDITPTP